MRINFLIKTQLFKTLCSSHQLELDNFRLMLRQQNEEVPGTVSIHPSQLHPLCCQQMLLLLSLAARQGQAIFRAWVCCRDKIISLGYFSIIWKVSTYLSSISLHLPAASKPHLLTLIDFQSNSKKMQLYFQKQGLMGKQLESWWSSSSKSDHRGFGFFALCREEYEIWRRIWDELQGWYELFAFCISG